MKFTRENMMTAFLVFIAVLAAFALAGHPIIPVEVLAGIGMMPMAFSGETDMAGLHEVLAKQGQALAEFTRKNEEKLGQLERDMIELAKKNGRPLSNGSSPVPPKHETWFDQKSRSPVVVLNHGQALAELQRKESGAPSVGRLLRGIVMGGRADDAKALDDERKALGISSDPAGGYTVAGGLASEWIDLMRSQMVLSQAGVRTVPMSTGSLSLARLTADPVVSWHGENGPLNDAGPTFGAVTLNAKTAVCLVKMSLELSQDSANIEQILQSALVSAMANAIDSAGLVGVTVNAGAAPGGVVSLANRNSVTGIGAPTTWDFLVDGMYELMLDNVPMDGIGALVAHPAVWKKMRKLKTGITNDNTPLTAPEEVAKLRKLWTTAAPLNGGDATGVLADWRDLLFGVRQDIQVRVLQESFLGTNLQIAVLAYARVDFAATRAQSFCTLEGITV